MGQGTITLGGSAFSVPAMLPTGPTMYRIANAGEDAHEFFVGRLGTGKTATDLQTALANPSDSDLPDWFEPFGGMEGMKAGGMGVVELNLQPGSYAAVWLWEATRSRNATARPKVSPRVRPASWAW